MSYLFTEIDLKGSIVLCRYGGIFRGLKVSFFPMSMSMSTSLFLFRSKEAKVRIMAEYIGMHKSISLQKVVPWAFLPTQTLKMMEL